MSSSRRLSLLLVVTACLCLWRGSVSAEDERAAPFSPEELQQLSRGELVSRPTDRRSQQNVRLLGGASWQVIDRPVEEVWSTLLDVSQYPKFLPQVVRASVVSDEGAQRTVLIEHGNSFIQLSYYLDVHLDPVAHRITFRVDESRPHDVRSGTGFYLLQPYAGSQRTLLAYGIVADIGDRFLAQLLRVNVQEWVLKVPWLLKRTVERAAKPRLSS